MEFYLMFDKILFKILPETLQFLQFIGERCQDSLSLVKPTESVNVGDLSCSPACHHSLPLGQVQAEVICISQTNWSETISLSIITLSFNIDLM